MKWIKCIWAFLVAFIGMCLICFFGLLGICAIGEIFNYQFAHYSDLMWYSVAFAFGVVGTVLGWYLFCDGLDKLSKK